MTEVSDKNLGLDGAGNFVGGEVVNHFWVKCQNILVVEGAKYLWVVKVAEFPKLSSNMVVYFSNLCYVYINKSRCKVSIN